MSDNKKKLMDAFVLIGNEKDSQAVPILRELVANGDVEAKFALAGLYLMVQDGVTINEQECIRLLKDAADNDGYEPAAGMLSAIYYEGIGTRKNYAESATYAKMVTDDETGDTEPWKGSIYNILGLMSHYGKGVTKNIPKAWHLLNFAATGLGSEDAKVNLAKLEEDYPMTAEGKIDLNRKGRSAWATFFLVISVLFSALATYMFYTEGYGLATFSVAAFCLCCLLVLFWVPYSIYGITALLLAGVVNIAFLLLGNNSHSIGTDFQSLAFSMLVFPSVFVHFVLLKRKKGYAHPWNILTRKEYDGRGPWEIMTSSLLAYGEGENYKTDSSQTKIANVVHYAISAALFVVAVLAAWNIAHFDFSFDIEWNCFKSPTLYGTLCFVGFFLQFFNWKHLSYKTYWKWKDPDTGKEYLERDRDMLTEVEGGFLMPLLGHVILAPMIYGALLYYLLMGGFALLQGFMPWALGILIFASVYPAHQSLGNFLDRRFRFVLIPGLGVIYFFIYYMLSALGK